MTDATNGASAMVGNPTATHKLSRHTGYIFSQTTFALNAVVRSLIASVVLVILLTKAPLAFVEPFLMGPLVTFAVVGIPGFYDLYEGINGRIRPVSLLSSLAFRFIGAGPALKMHVDSLRSELARTTDTQKLALLAVRFKLNCAASLVEWFFEDTRYMLQDAATWLFSRRR